MSKINSLKNIIKLFGIKKTIRILIYYSLIGLKQKTMSETSGEILNINGYKISLLPGDKGISAELKLFKCHEPLTTKFVRKNLKEGMTCIDMGANIGYYALLESRRVGSNGKVFAFEPSPTNFECLSKNRKLNDAHNMKLYNFACGDKDGTINFIVNDQSNLCKVVEENSTELKTIRNSTVGNVIDVIKIPLKKLDSVIKQESISEVDFIRMDLEGYEFKAYCGMRETIQNFHPQLLIELHRIFLGDDVTVKFLEYFEEDDYEVKYYLPRWLDTPIVGDENDVQKITISTLKQKLRSGSLLPDIFQIFLTPSTNKKERSFEPNLGNKEQ